MAKRWMPSANRSWYNIALEQIQERLFEWLDTNVAVSEAVLDRHR
jgi:hypothetical protein